MRISFTGSHRLMYCHACMNYSRRKYNKKYLSMCKYKVISTKGMYLYRPIMIFQSQSIFRLWFFPILNTGARHDIFQLFISKPLYNINTCILLYSGNRYKKLKNFMTIEHMWPYLSALSDKCEHLPPEKK